MKLLSQLFRKPTREGKVNEPPRYPPFVKGLPAASPERLLSDHDVLVKRIFQAVRATNKEYRTHYLPLMVRYAAFVHLLPASESHHHRGAGGLLRHGLEVALWAIQQCENAVYALEAHPETRRQATLKWEYAVFTGGLCHDVGKCVSDMAVTDRSGSHVWNPFEDTLYEWLENKKIDRYHIRWRDVRHGRHEKIAPLVLDRVLLQQGRAYLAEIGPEPLECMISALNGSLSGGTENQVYSMINKADRASVEHDLKNQPLDGDGIGNVATPVVMSLFDAMRRLVRRKKWIANKKGARVWFIQGRLFLVWPAAAKDITAQLDQDGVPGIPKDPDTIADILIERELAIPYRKVTGEPLRRYWQIVPAALDNSTLVALEIADPTRLYDPVPSADEGQILDPVNDPQITEVQTQENSAPPEGQEKEDQPSKPKKVKKKRASDKDQKAEKKTVDTVASDNRDEVPLPPEPDLSDIFQPEFEQQQSLDLFPEISVPSEAEQEPKTATVNEPAKLPVPMTLPENPDMFASGDGVAGEVLMALADDLKTGKRKWQIDALVTDLDLIAIPHPETTGAFGVAASEILMELKEQDWLESDPNNIMRSLIPVPNFRSTKKKTKEITRTSVVLTTEASYAFLMLANTTAEQVHQIQKPPKNQISETEKTTTEKDRSSAKKSDIEPTQKPKREGKKRKPNPRKNLKKAALIAQGAYAATEQDKDEGKTLDLKVILRKLIFEGDADLPWDEGENRKTANLEAVCTAIHDNLVQNGHKISKREIIRSLPSLSGLKISRTGRHRTITIDEESNAKD